MAGLCSKHWNIKDPNCDLCNATISDIFPDWEEKHKEAVNAGTHTCSCGFTYYLTTNSCPKCGKPYN